MIFLFSLALRNLFRNFRRTIITSIAVVFGVALPILGWGLVDGLDENVLRAARNSTVGDVLLRPEDYPTDGLDYPLAKAKPVPPDLAKKLDDAGDWTTRVVFPSRVVHGSDATRANGMAYDAARDDTVFPRSEWKIVGRWPEAGKPELVLGKGLARLLDVKPGTDIVIEARTLPGALNALSYTVVGVVDTNNVGLDNLSFWVEMSSAESLLTLDGARTHLAVKAHGSAASAAAALAGSGWTAKTVNEECADLIEVNKVRRVALLILVGIILLISATGIANTVIMAAYERVREIGTLLALGMRRSEVRAMFLLEGGAMGAVAGVIGAVLGTAAVVHWQSAGINLGQEVLEKAGDIPMSAVLYTQFSWPPIAIALGFGVLVATLASLWPALYASNLNPADAVKAD